MKKYYTYILLFLFLSISFYSFTPGILFTLPSESSENVVNIVHAFLYYGFLILSSFIWYFITGGGVDGAMSLIAILILTVPIVAIFFYIFTPDVLFQLPPNGSKEIVAGTHSLLFGIGSQIGLKLIINFMNFIDRYRRKRLYR
jgi:hypothetical protein